MRSREELQKNRSDFLKVGKVMTAAILGTFLFPESCYNQDESQWPENQEGILSKIKERRFEPDSELRTTIFPRKIMWEIAQVKKRDGTWPEGHDESDWFNHLELFKEGVKSLAEAGIKGARLVIVPSEITLDGVNYKWERLETAIELLQQYHVKIDLAVGPLNTPYYPGVRIPPQLEDQLESELVTIGEDQVDVSLTEDDEVPESSNALREYGFTFLEKIMDRYGHDERIDKFYLGNEWPDEQRIEGVDVEGKDEVTLRVKLDYMLELARRMLEKTAKRIAINTNIPATEPRKMQAELGPLLNLLGKQGVLGLDVYPTEDDKGAWNFDELMEKVRQTFPSTQLIFTELQASPWPPAELTGDSWVDIFSKHPELVTEYYEGFYPPTIDNYIVASRIQEVGLWGAEVWLVLQEMGYSFPSQMLATIAQAMDDSEA